jgi:hypothetical protein
MYEFHGVLNREEIHTKICSRKVKARGKVENTKST